MPQLTTRFTILAAAFLLALFVVSCSNDADHKLTLPENDVSREWTVMFYGAGENSLDLDENGMSEVAQIVRNMERSHAGDHVTVLACLNSAATQHECRVISVEFQPSNGGHDIQSAVLENWGTQNMADHNILQRFLQWSVDRNPAHRYALIMGGAGAGWKGTCIDEQTSLAMMPISGVRTAISATQTGGQALNIDLLAWLMPEMGSLEVAYELRTVVHYMAGVSWLQPFKRADALREWLFELGTNPFATSEQVGQDLVDAVRNLAERESLPSRFSLLDNSALHNFSTELNSFSTDLITLLESNSELVLSSRDSAWVEHTDQPDAIDLATFLQFLSSDSSSIVNGTTANVQQVLDALQHVIRYSQGTTFADLRPGMSIYLPVYQPDVDLTAYESLEFSQANSQWTEFLRRVKEDVVSQNVCAGTVFWPNRALSNIRFFVNTAQTGAIRTLVDLPIEFMTFFGEDSATYNLSFSLGMDSVDCYLGAYRDINGSSTPDVGDSLGWYKRRGDTAPRTWFNLQSGASMDSVHFTIDRVIR